MVHQTPIDFLLKQGLRRVGIACCVQRRNFTLASCQDGPYGRGRPTAAMARSESPPSALGRYRLTRPLPAFSRVSFQALPTGAEPPALDSVGFSGKRGWVKSDLFAIVS